MRQSLQRIEKDFESFFEFPIDDKDSVTSTSCKLFAEYCVDKASNEMATQIGQACSFTNGSDLAKEFQKKHKCKLK